MLLKLNKSILVLFAISTTFLLFSSSSAMAQEIRQADVVENKLVTLIGEGYDEDGNDLAFKWEQFSGEPVVLSAYDIPEPTFMAPSVPNGFTKVLVFKLTVTDPQGASDTDMIQINVLPVNLPPVVDAGKDQVIFPTVNAVTMIGTALDPDNDALNYSWKQLSGQPVEIANPFQKHLTIAAYQIDFNNMEPLEFEFTAEDGFGGVGSDTVLLYPLTGGITNPNLIVDAGPFQTVKEGEVVTLQATGTASNNGPITYTWFQGIGPKVQLSSYTGSDVTFVAPDVPREGAVLSFQVTGYSPGLGYASDITIVRVVEANGPPVADAGPDQQVRESVLVNLSGKGTDPDGDKISFQWNQKSGSPVSIIHYSSSEISFWSPVISGDSEDFVFDLTVTDSRGNFDVDSAVITVSKVNLPPVANAGPDRSVFGDTDVTIVGSGWDPDNDPITFAWTQVSGRTVQMQATEGTISFKAPHVVSGETLRLVFQLAVTDSHDQTGTDVVIISVVPENSRPIVDVGPDRIVDENTLVEMMCNASDPDGDYLLYQWSVTGGNIVLSSTTTPPTSFTAPTVVKNTVLTLTCTVSDGVLTGTDSATITVRNVLTLPIVADAGPDRIVNEQVSVQLDGSKSYDPENQPLKYSWKQVSGETVQLDSSSAIKPKFVSPTVANGEVKVLVFELTVSDDNGRSATDSVTITVDPINAPPEAVAGARQD